MRMQSLARRLAFVAGTLALSACMAGVPLGVDVVYVQQRPPHGIVEVRGVVPGPGYVWVPGYYQWRGSTYVWISGRYTLVERGYRSWVPGEWRHTRRGWYWVDGHWRR